MGRRRRVRLICIFIVFCYQSPWRCAFITGNVPFALFSLEAPAQIGRRKEMLASFV